MGLIPFSAGIPLGVLLLLVGTVLFFATRWRSAAFALIALGVLVVGGTVAVIWFASQM